MNELIATCHLIMKNGQCNQLQSVVTAAKHFFDIFLLDKKRNIAANSMVATEEGRPRSRDPLFSFQWLVSDALYVHAMHISTIISFSRLCLLPFGFSFLFCCIISNDFVHVDLPY